MLKRILCLLTLCALLCSAALAEPRYPEQSGVATDSAAILSAKLLEDLRTLDKRLIKADAPRLYIATVDFLDASNAQDYADTLFTRWALEDDAVLLLLCAGEEVCAISAGINARRLLPATMLEKLLATHASEPFDDLEYDVAVAAFAKAYVTEVCKACGVTIKVEDLFRTTSSGIFGNWASSQRAPETSGDGESFFTREDKASGFSFLNVLLIVALLVLVFGTFRKGQKMRQPAGADPTPEQEPPTPGNPGKRGKTDDPGKPVYFRPREKKPTPQYFHPRKPK